MNILLAVIQILFNHLNDNMDRLEMLRARRDLDDPVIIPPVIYDEEPTITDKDVEIVSNTPVIDQIMADRETPGITSSTTTGLNINLYSEPWCGTGLYKFPGVAKDIILTVSLLINLFQLIMKIRKSIQLRRRRQQAAANHPINRPILGQLGK